MRTISNREFIANPELYLGMACDEEVRIRKGRRVIRLVSEPESESQPVLQPDDELRRAITFDELMVGVHEDIRRKWAERRK
jgi:hypothetical protein